MACGLALSAQSHAATVRTWTGASPTSGNWTTAANWAGGAPLPGDILNFVDAGARKVSNTNNYAAGTTFSVINCFGTGYRLRGNRVTITNSIAVGNPAGAHIIDLDLTLGGNDPVINLTSFASAAALTLNGDINLGAHTLLTEGPGDYTITGVISGTGGILKNNSGELSLSGFGANSYTGLTSVQAGILRLNRYLLNGLNPVGTVAIPGDLTVGSFASALIGDVVVLDRDNQIANSSMVSINATGSLELSDENDTVGELRLRGGTVTTGSGALAVEGGIYASLPSSVSKDSLIAGKLTLGARGDGPQLIDVASGVQLAIGAQVSGVSTATLIKTNRGELILTASNLFSGDVEIKGGLLTMTDGHALGSTNGATKLILGSLRVNPVSPMGIPEYLEVVGPLATLSLDEGSVSWLGGVTLDDDLSIVIPTNSVLTILGLISGPAGWTKTGDGTLQFKTAHTNTYGGTSWVREGNFIMDGVFNQPVIPGAFVIGNAVDPTNSTRAWAIKQNQIADTSPVTINPSGVLQLGFANDTIGSLTLNGGAAETDGGTLTLNGDILAVATNEIARISGNLSLGGVTRTIYTLGASNTPDLIVSAVISDGGASAGFNKVGEGSLRVSGASTFNGPVSVTDGTLRLAHPDALGTSFAGTIVSGIDGPKIILEGGFGMTIAEPLTLNSTGPGSPVVLENFTGNNHWNGPIQLLAPQSVINVPSIPRPLSLGGVISGPGGLSKIGSGILTLDGLTTNTFNGLTIVTGGDLVLDKPGDNEAIHGDITIGDDVGSVNSSRVRIRGGGSEIWNGARVVINSSGQLILEGVLDLVGSIEGSGNIFLPNGPFTAGLIVGRNDLSTTFSGVISGTGNFHKTGLGTLRLTGNHAYTGPTQLDEGRLEIDGSIASSQQLLITRNVSAPVFLNRFGTLGGSGAVPRVINRSGEISPGVDLPTSTARINVQGNLELSNGVFRVQLNGTVPGAQYDQLRVTGDVNLGANVSSILFAATGFPPSTNDVFVLIDKLSPGPVIGTFNNLPDGAVMGSGFNKYQIRYTGGDGNDVTLRRVEIPGSSFTGITPVGAEKMKITGQGWPYVTYILEATPTLTAPAPWTPIATNNANALGVYEFIDAYADNGTSLFPARFYRVQSP